jgi:hypothetical protein
MAKERGSDSPKGEASGRKLTGWKATVRSAILWCVHAWERICKPWESAKKLFAFREVDDGITAAIPEADIGLAIQVLALAGIITFIMSLASIASSAYIINAQSDALTIATGVVQPKLAFNDFIAPAILVFIMYLPVGMLVTFALEWLAYQALHALGGKATLAQHIYLASIITLSMSFASGMLIFAPVPCLQILGAMALLAADIYLAIFVESKAYSIAHKIGILPAAVAAFIVSLAKLAAFYLIINAVSAVLGLPPQMSLPKEIFN